MNLVIDAGNTAIKIALYDQEKMVLQKTVSEITYQLLNELLQNFSPEAVIFSSTRATTASEIRPFIPRHIPVYELNHDLPIPIAVEYETPETLGRDRIAAAVAAYTLFPNQHSLIIDLGTALTIDHVSEKGVFKGGIISPGLALRFKALHHFTGKLPLVEPILHSQLTGTSTTTAIQFGVQNGMLFEINGYIAKYREAFKDINVIVTGGDSQLFVPNICDPKTVNSFLVLNGLNEILRFIRR